MGETFPRVTLFIPGTAQSASAWQAALHREGLELRDGLVSGEGLGTTVEAEWIANDGAFGQAFSFGTVQPPVVETIDAAPGALVLHCHADLRDGRQDICSAIQRLRSSGALAVRLEQSKLGWEIDRWLELMTSGDPWRWHRAAVTILIEDGVLQSCGMHAFSLPDAHAPVDTDARELQEFVAALNVYQLDEDPVVLSGQTFAPDSETPRRVVERWPDAGYPPDHPCHNPYGVWRLGPAGGSARPPDELAYVFIPSLHAILLAQENEAGSPLTRAQVEATRDASACITMEHRDAQLLERSRGYADLDPELAWEQWQVARGR
jgi:hypothetical protein